ncbi:MAG: hypothetical protein BRC58_01180 [Cyanobacteria bacterium QS_8_64_29]|nr:MAG: hypothetical protein BRC58_01180 [Cyanobacteria bacterium QS_8_64_29]
MPADELQLTVTVRASQPALLRGLDLWLRWGLIDEDQVRHLGRERLCCALPQPRPTVRSVAGTSPAAKPQRARKSQPLLPGLPRGARAWQGFKDELSVRWLLFLGVFLVVVSSGVLAATQWSQFPPSGQYAILGAYTLGFWGAGLVASLRARLRLTAQTLQAVALLLVPVNVWALDSFGLAASPGVKAAIALPVLSALVGITLRPSASWGVIAVVLGLSFLQGGWALPHGPIAAAYAGTAGSAAAIAGWRRQGQARSGVAALAAYAGLLLLVRAVFIAQLPLGQLSLAIALGGSALVLLEDHRLPVGRWRTLGLWEGLGMLLLGLGIGSAASTGVAGQALAASVLAGATFVRRLRQYQQRADLAVLFAIGLQAPFWLWQWLPLPLRQRALEALTHGLGLDPALSDALLGLSLFPYLLLWLGFAGWLKRRGWQALAHFADGLALLLGLILAAIAPFPPSTRTLNLVLSAAALGGVTYRRYPQQASPAYLTQAGSSLAILSGVGWASPSMGSVGWGSVLLGMAVAEWAASLRFWGAVPALSRSCWSWRVAATWHSPIALGESRLGGCCGWPFRSRLPAWLQLRAGPGGASRLPGPVSLALPSGNR